jgi:hypothetical protein
MRLFGTDTRQRFRAIDNDCNQRMTRSELVSWLAYPSLRNSRTPSFGTPSGPRDSMLMFDSVKAGTRRHADGVEEDDFELAQRPVPPRSPSPIEILGLARYVLSLLRSML